MSQITTEQKLQLAHAIREENRQNRMRLRHRENILTGASIPLAENPPEQRLGDMDGYAAFPESSRDAEVQGMTPSFAKLRLLTALFLFAGFFFLDLTKTTVWGINSNFIEDTIKKDYVGNLFDFVDSFPDAFQKIADQITIISDK